MADKAASSGSRQATGGHYVTRSRAEGQARTTVRETKSGQFQVALPTKAVKTLTAREANVRVIMEVLSDHIVESQESGRPTGFFVEVDARGRAHVRHQAAAASDAAPTAAATDDDLETALAAARARGRSKAAEILAGAEMLSADDFAELLGVSRVTVNAKRQRNEVLGLDGARRGFRFPAWQVDDNGKPFAVLAQLAETLGGPWSVYRFLLQRHPDLGGVAALDALRKGRGPDVLAAAEAQAEGAVA